MGTVLLAVNGSNPSPDALEYALDLGRRLKADLRILQIVQSREIHILLRRIKDGACKARNFFENNMIAVTFAEEGDFDSARLFVEKAEQNLQDILPPHDQTEIHSELIMSAGKTDQVIINYVRENKGIVAAVYDPNGATEKPEKYARRIKREAQSLSKKLPIPIVVVESRKET